jgi:hypothetical protein
MIPKPPTDPQNAEQLRTVAEAMASAPPPPDDAPELTDEEIAAIEREIVAEVDEAIAGLTPASPDDPDLPI